MGLGEFFGDILAPILGGPGPSAQQGAMGTQSQFINLLADLARQQNQLAQEKWGAVEPMFNQFAGNLFDVLQGNYQPGSSPMYGPLREGVESQYDVAQENIMGNLPQGGALVDALANLETARASGLGNILAGLTQDDINRAFTMATGNIPDPSGMTMSSALAGQGNLLNTIANLNTNAMQNMTQAGMGAGMLWGMGGMGGGGPAGGIMPAGGTADLSPWMNMNLLG